MKSLFKVFFILLSLTVALLLEPLSLQAQPIDKTGSIQNIKTETVVLLSNNILNGEISSYQEENNHNFSGSSPFIVTDQTNNIYDKNNTLIKGSFIHNLSTNKQKVQKIRAP